MKKTIIAASVVATAAVLSACSGQSSDVAQVSASPAASTISEAEALNAQQQWCSALVSISQTHQQDGLENARALAAQVLESAYAYQQSGVLFKPTLATGSLEQTFRTTQQGAFAYFVGGDAAFPQDTGFALKGWTACQPDNAVVQIHGDTALTMGHVHFTGADGKRTTVDKTWAFRKFEDGSIRVVLHHSSIPYSG